MPSITNSDHANVFVTEFSYNNSTSKFSSLFINDQGKESNSCNSSNMSTIYPSQMRSTVMENNNAMKSDDYGISSWEEQLQTHNSIEDFNSYPLKSLSEDLTEANFDVFHHI